MSWKVLITCEHGGNQIPEAYQSAFAGKSEWLESHRGYDIGALELFRLLAANLADEQEFSETSRLLVELNRSLHHRALFSEAAKTLPQSDREQILATYYRPYRQRVEDKIRRQVEKGNRVIHISVHSFTPVLNGEERKADIGLLYDPKRLPEKKFCRLWKNNFRNCTLKASVFFNYPYKGTADGFTTYLRMQFDAGTYIGIELEVNQKFPQGNADEWQKMQDCILDSLAGALNQFVSNNSV
jgi:predicted N-formylglutamate amidohydrolase